MEADSCKGGKDVSEGLLFLRMLLFHRRERGQCTTTSQIIFCLSLIRRFSDQNVLDMPHTTSTKRCSRPSASDDPATAGLIARPKVEKPGSGGSPDPAMCRTPSSNGRPEHTHSAPSNSKKATRDRGPNWNVQEIFLLIQEKRDLHLAELDTADARHLMQSDSAKWASIAHNIQLAGYSTFRRDTAACKTKWNQLHTDYKKIADFSRRTGVNALEYWSMSATVRRRERLPRQFPRKYFDAIDEWNGNKPHMNPPHGRDLLSTDDGNFTVPPSPGALKTVENDSASDPQHRLQRHAMREDMSHRVQSAAQSVEKRKSAPTGDVGAGPSKPCKRGRQYAGLPHGAVPLTISSSSNTSATARRGTGNTGMRRKNVAGHTVIAEATKATGTVMASQMQAIADASLIVERSKIDLQAQLFREQMAYQRHRDRKLHESAMASNETAKLAVMKQGEVVNALALMTQVLGQGLPSASYQKLHKAASCSPDSNSCEIPSSRGQQPQPGALAAGRLVPEDTPSFRSAQQQGAKKMKSSN